MFAWYHFASFFKVCLSNEYIFRISLLGFFPDPGLNIHICCQIHVRQNSDYGTTDSYLRIYLYNFNSFDSAFIFICIQGLSLELRVPLSVGGVEAIEASVLSAAMAHEERLNSLCGVWMTHSYKLLSIICHVAEDSPCPPSPGSKQVLALNIVHGMPD